MRRALFATLIALMASGWAAPSAAFVSPGYGRGNQRHGFRGRWKLTSSSYAYEWEIGDDHVRIFSPSGGAVATEGDWKYLEGSGDKQHVRLVRHGVDDVDYEGWIDDKGVLSLHVMPTESSTIMQFERME